MNDKKKKEIGVKQNEPNESEGVLGVYIFESYFNAMKKLPSATKKWKLFEAIFNYACYGTVCEMDDNIRSYFDIIAPIVKTGRIKKQKSKEDLSGELLKKITAKPKIKSCAKTVANDNENDIDSEQNNSEPVVKVEQNYGENSPNLNPKPSEKSPNLSPKSNENSAGLELKPNENSVNLNLRAGEKSVKTQLTAGEKSAKICSKLDENLVKSQPKLNQNLAKTQPKLGQNLAKTRRKSGENCSKIRSEKPLEFSGENGSQETSKNVQKKSPIRIRTKIRTNTKTINVCDESKISGFETEPVLTCSHTKEVDDKILRNQKLPITKNPCSSQVKKTPKQLAGEELKLVSQVNSNRRNNARFKESIKVKEKSVSNMQDGRDKVGINEVCQKGGADEQTEILVPKVLMPKAREEFCPPTLEEVKEFTQKNNLAIDPERFFFYYETRGWKTGKSKMVSWPSCARMWHAKELKDQKAKVEEIKKSDVNRFSRGATQKFGGSYTNLDELIGGTKRGK